MDLELGKLSRKRYLKYLLFSIIGVAMATSAFLYQKKEVNPPELRTQSINMEEKYPRLANLFFKWDITDIEAKELAKWDLVAIDMEAGIKTPENLKKIREYNPNIKILAYITAQEFTYREDLLKESVLRRKIYKDFSEDWWLKTKNGGRLIWWPGTWMINVTNDAGVNKKGQRWNEYLPEFIASNVLSTGYWDGVFYDNTWDGVVWLPSGKELDFNEDGVADGAEEIDKKWQEGMEKIFQKTRELAPDKIVMSNGGKTYANLLNGITIEHFHRMDWSWGMNDYFTVLKEDQDPETMILACNTDNTGISDDYKKMRYCFASALLGDGYFAFDYGDQAHNYLWWYDEYDVFLGRPNGSAYNILDPKNQDLNRGVWRRDFERGIVLVNSTDKKQTIFLEDEFHKINGNQDKEANSGEIVKKISLEANDGIILLKISVD
ncbi:hypothetical protein A2316_00630 [Candidatus Falkowbacteria bacterium RIFOXYB2_FULL_38_15]|nr:MAG: hypothetical protein A2316_00630 [Candidatus Falkowbacteria bacterium RIFOXYB2_FULL_38_15]